MRLTEEDILEINHACPEDQGVFKQPNGVPYRIDEHVIYTRYQIGYKGGSCFDDADMEREHVEVEPPHNKLEVLNLVLKKLKPDIKPTEVSEVFQLIQTSDDNDHGYYGDYSLYDVEYIILRDLYHLLDIFEER